MLRMITHEEAVKEFPDNGYEIEDEEAPFTHLVVGTRAEVRAAFTVIRRSRIQLTLPSGVIALAETEENLVEDDAVAIANNDADIEFDLDRPDIAFVPVVRDSDLT